LPQDISVLDVSRDQAIELLKQPKRGRNAAAPKEPLKILEKSPVTEQEVRVLDGRYGPYVTDGESNASLPKDASPETLTMEQALMLLAERAAKAPKKKKSSKKKAAKKTTTKSATKKATTKKAAKKKGSTKKAGAKKAAVKKAVKKQDDTPPSDTAPWEASSDDE
jgi:DNA topoisomerase-1